MAKSFKTNIQGADKLFSVNDISDAQDIQSTQDILDIEDIRDLEDAKDTLDIQNIRDTKGTLSIVKKEPKKKGFYRINLKLDGELEEYIKEEAWKNKLSVTDYLNSLIRADRDKNKG